MPRKNEEYRALRDALATFPTGVCVVTTADENGTRVGLTVNSYTSVSLDPPLILWCLEKNSTVMPYFERSDYFAVNILSEDQLEVSKRFAGTEKKKFSDLECEAGEGGAPLLTGCTAHLECKKWSQHDGGDHVIIVGEVIRFDGTDRPALAYCRGAYTGTTPLP